MNEQQTAALLASDIQNHLAWFQVSILLVAMFLIVIALILFSRAYAALTEARMIQSQFASENAGSTGSAQPRIATAGNINAGTKARKIASKQRIRALT